MTVHPSNYKVECPFCRGQVTFPSSDLGKLAECPNCKQDIELELPKSSESWVSTRPVAVPQENLTAKIVLGYVSAFILPPIGLALGIYLILKKESGHGVGCIAISFIIPLYLALRLF
jgi:uncharacterized paraquat-inducible protein A